MQCLDAGGRTPDARRVEMGRMTDSAPKISDSSLIRTVTLQRLASQLEKMEKSRRRSIQHGSTQRRSIHCSAESKGSLVRPAESRPPSHESGTRESGAHRSASRDLELSEKVISTGIEALDRLLPDAGFREGTLVEWLAESASGDLLALLAAEPALGKDRFLIVIDNEKTFYPPAAAALGIDLRRLILVRPEKFARSLKTPQPVLSPSKKIVGNATPLRTKTTRSETSPPQNSGGQTLHTQTLHTQTLWALEQTLQSRGVAVTFCRLPRPSARVFRRLQLAAERGGGLGFLIRAPSARNEPSWSDVRLWVESVPELISQSDTGEFSPSGRRWRVEVLRCRRGAAGQRSILLEYNDATHTVHPASEPLPAKLPKRARRA